jgi:hypothetical protein
MKILDIQLSDFDFEVKPCHMLKTLHFDMRYSCHLRVNVRREKSGLIPINLRVIVSFVMCSMGRGYC